MKLFRTIFFRGCPLKAPSISFLDGKKLSVVSTFSPNSPKRTHVKIDFPPKQVKTPVLENTLFYAVLPSP